MSEIKIQIKSLYKIFGKNSKSALEQVKDGVNKDELLEKHNHVLGLKDCLLYTSPSPRDDVISRMPSSA